MAIMTQAQAKKLCEMDDKMLDVMDLSEGQECGR